MTKAHKEYRPDDVFGKDPGIRSRDNSLYGSDFERTTTLLKPKIQVRTPKYLVISEL